MPLPPATFLTGTSGGAPAPGDLALLPDFVDAAASASLLTAVLGGGAPPPATSAEGWLPGPGWKAVAGRAVKSVGGTVLGSTLIPAPLPSWAAALFARLGEAGLDFRGDEGEAAAAAAAAGKATAPTAAAAPAAATPNHALINAYSAGSGILAHTDGPAYAAVAAILSLGDDSPALMHFYPIPGDNGGGAPPPPPLSSSSSSSSPSTPTPAFSVFLPPRSLLVFRGGVYSAHMHGIDAATEDALGEEGGSRVLNWRAAAAWWAARRRQQGGQEQQQAAETEEAEGSCTEGSCLSIPRGPLRVSLTVRRVKRVRAGVLRL